MEEVPCWVQRGSRCGGGLSSTEWEDFPPNVWRTLVLVAAKGGEGDTEKHEEWRRVRKRCQETGWGGDTAAWSDSHPRWPGPSPALHTLLGSVSKDESLFLEERFISFHSKCLLLSWACNSAGLCYKGASQPRGPNLAASGMVRRAWSGAWEDVPFCRVRLRGPWPCCWPRGVIFGKLFPSLGFTVLPLLIFITTMVTMVMRPMELVWWLGQRQYQPNSMCPGGCHSQGLSPVFCMHIAVYVFVCMCMYMHVYTCTSLWAYVHMCVHDVCDNAYICVCACTCACIYVCIYTPCF